MNIGVILPEIGGFSSVSLEFFKWYHVIKELGHTVFILTGKSRDFTHNVTVMSDFFIENDYNMYFSSRLFELTDDDGDVISEFEKLSFRIESILNNWVETNQLDILIVENYFSVPINLPVSYALFILFQKISCKKIIKHHDAFYRSNLETLSKSSFIRKLLVSCFPLDVEDTVHISCNRLVKSYLKEKCNVDSIIIPYVFNFNKSLELSGDNNFSDGYSSMLTESFEMLFSDKVLINFSDLLPSTNFEKMFHLLENIHDDSFKIISIVREHKDYLDYFNFLNDKIHDLNLSSRIVILKEDDFLLNEYVNIDYLFTFARGILCFDSGVGFGQPLHMAIQHKCPLLICTQSHLDWLELSDLGCKRINISEKLTDQDIVSINRYLHLDLNWGELNYGLMKQYYSMNFLQYLINGVLMRI